MVRPSVAGCNDMMDPQSPREGSDIKFWRRRCDDDVVATPLLRRNLFAGLAVKTIRKQCVCERICECFGGLTRQLRTQCRLVHGFFQRASVAAPKPVT